MHQREPPCVVDPAGGLLGEVLDRARLRAARQEREPAPQARLALYALCVAMPSSQGFSEPPSGSTLSLVRQAARKVSDIASSASAQLPVSRRAWL